MSHAKRLRQLLSQPGGIVAPGMFDALTGLLIQQQGFDCGYLGGASISYSRIAQPDIGLTSFGEVTQVVAQIRERVDIPFVVDADTGFGNALNVQRTVTVLERMGASGIQLEDQTMPKRCGHLAGKTLIPTAEMAGKIAAATDARVDDDTVIVARTDAIAVEGFDAARARANAYAEAGADVLFIEAPEDEQQMIQLGREFGPRIPLIANMVEGGRTPLKPAAELFDLGFKLVIYPGAMIRVLVSAAKEYLSVLHETGSTDAVRGRMLNFGELNDVLGTDSLLERGKRYDS
ncbi:MAG: isocitrate lyase/phosphoenolpyruvate mutase family protein [Gammaproteobacteria bacterium]